MFTPSSILFLFHLLSSSSGPLSLSLSLLLEKRKAFRVDAFEEQLKSFSHSTDWGLMLSKR
jgi:hypothetical protein